MYLIVAHSTSLIFNSDDMKNICTHIPGFPRIGARRELKTALERHWRGELSAAELEATGRALRARHRSCGAC